MSTKEKNGKPESKQGFEESALISLISRGSPVQSGAPPPIIPAVYHSAAYRPCLQGAGGVQISPPVPDRLTFPPTFGFDSGTGARRYPSSLGYCYGLPALVCTWDVHPARSTETHTCAANHGSALSESRPSLNTDTKHVEDSDHPKPYLLGIRTLPAQFSEEVGPIGRRLWDSRLAHFDAFYNSVITPLVMETLASVQENALYAAQKQAGIVASAGTLREAGQDE